MIKSVDELLTKLREYDYHHHHFAAPILNVLDEATFYRIAVVDEHMHFLYLSINAAEFVGLPQKAILGKRWSDFDVDQGVLQYLENLATQALQSGLPCQGTCRSPFKPFPESVFEFFFSPYPKKDPHVVVMAIRDVTEVQRSFSALAYKSEQLNQLIDLSPLGIIIVDKVGLIEYINQPILQHTASQLSSYYIGTHVSILYDEVKRNYTDSIIQKALNGESMHQFYLKTKGRILLCCAFPLKNATSSEVIGATAIFQDITDFETMKNELVKYDRLNLVSEMAAGVAHEIRNPMTVVKGYLQLFQAKMPEHFTEQFQLVLDELERVETIIANFLSLAKNKSVELTPNNLNDVILELSPLILSEGILHSTRVDFSLAEQLPLIQCDIREIKQLILNLCQNGIQAMVKPGELSISTSVENNYVILKVTDRGCGIPEESLERIFDPFYTTKDTGTGLGLPVCHSIMERHNGKIHITSTIGAGTEFAVTFPAIKSEIVT